MTSGFGTTKRVRKNVRRRRPPSIQLDTVHEPVDQPPPEHLAPVVHADPVVAHPVPAAPPPNPVAPRSAVSRIRRKLRTVVGRTNVIEDRDLATVGTAVAAGTANPVNRARLRIKLGDSNEAFFKLDDQVKAPAQYAVATSRLARALGLGGLVARVKFYRLNNAPGAVASKVPGRSLFSWVLNPQGKQVGLTYQDVDFLKPGIQQGLADLQLFDAITGQTDRHGGNIYVDGTSERVSGIDEDLSFGAGVPPHLIAAPDGKYLGLPSLVDAGTAAKVLALRPADVKRVLQGRPGDPVTLSGEEIAAAQERLTAVQEHIRGLQSRNELVTTWDKSTYDKALAEPDGVDPKGLPIEKSYLKRQVTRLTKARTHQADTTIFDVQVGNVTVPAWVEGTPPRPLTAYPAPFVVPVNPAPANPPAVAPRQPVTKVAPPPPDPADLSTRRPPPVPPGANPAPANPARPVTRARPAPGDPANRRPPPPPPSNN
jgi:hypothetical protein